MGLRDRHNQRKEERREFGIGGTCCPIPDAAEDACLGRRLLDRRTAMANASTASTARCCGFGTRWIFEDAQGDKLCKIQTRVMHIRDTMAIEDADGNRLAPVHQALITPMRERWKVDVENGEDMEIHGNIVDHEYEIEADGRQGRRGVQALVPSPRHLWGPGRTDGESGSDPGCQRCPRRDGPPRQVARSHAAGKSSNDFCSRGTV